MISETGSENSPLELSYSEIKDRCEYGLGGDLYVKFKLSWLSASKQSMQKAYTNISRGKGSRTQGPIYVKYDLRAEQFLIADGYHRVAKAYDEGKEWIIARISERPNRNYLTVRDNFFSDSIAESAKSDRKQRKNAKRIVDSLLRATKNITEWREFGYVSEDGRFFLYPWKLNGFHRRDFIFAFSASKRSGYGEIDYSKGEKKHLIQIYALRAKGDLSGLSKTLQKRRPALTHEVIHALDRGRNKSDTESWARPEHGYEAYFSSPTEFNAYYQEAIAKYERRLEGLSQEEKRKFSNLKLKSFRDFKEFFYNNILNKGFKKYANNKYHKKMKKRLYKYYTEERRLKKFIREELLREDRIENLKPSPIDHIKKSQMLKRKSQRNIEKYNFYDFNLVNREKGYYEINLRSKIVNAKVERPEQNMLTFSFRSPVAMRRAKHMAGVDGPLAVARTIIKILDHYAGVREIKRYINAFCVLSNAAPSGLDAPTLKNAFRRLIKEKPGEAMETDRGEIVLTF